MMQVKSRRTKLLRELGQQISELPECEVGDFFDGHDGSFSNRTDIMAWVGQRRTDIAGRTVVQCAFSGHFNQTPPDVVGASFSKTTRNGMAVEQEIFAGNVYDLSVEQLNLCLAALKTCTAQALETPDRIAS